MSKPVRYYQLCHLIVAHFKELIREPAVIFWGIVFPMLISLGLGMAFTQKGGIEHHIGLIVSQETSENGDLQIREFLGRHAERIANSENQVRKYRLVIENPKMGDTTFVFTQTDWDRAMILLKRGRLNLVLEDTGSGVKYHLDPGNPDAELAYLKLSKVLEDGSVQAPRVAANIDPLTVTGTRYIDFLVPGLIAMGAMMSCMWGISYGMIDKRSKKLLRRMVATPMRKSHFLIALMAVRIAMNIIEAALLFVFARLVFDISVKGSIPALALIFVSGNIAFCGLAIFVSSRTANTEVGNGLINAVVLPLTVLSGIFFSYYNFPEEVVPFIQKLPLTLLTDGIRSIFTEGAGFAETGSSSVILLVFGVFFFSIGLRVFRWH